MAVYLVRDLMNEVDSMRPSCLLNQDFGIGLITDNLLHSGIVRQQLPMMRHYFRPRRMDNKDSGSTVKCDKDCFQVNLDVQQFSPEEVQVKVVGNSVVVEGKHEEKQDEHGYISRQFVRRFEVPKDYKLDAIASSLSSDGVLTISAPRCENESHEKVIPITHTGPHKAVEDSVTK